MGPRALIVAGVAVVAYFWLRKSASADEPKAGFGQSGFVQGATPDAPATVTGCSYTRAGSIFIDVNTGREISAAEMQKRAKSEGCLVLSPNIFVQGNVSP